MIMEKNGFISRNGSVKVYKVSRMANRKDAKRHHIANVLAENEEDAKNEFMEYVGGLSDNQTARYQLYTGDWKRLVTDFY